MPLMALSYYADYEIYSVAEYGVAGFGVYGVDIWAEADEAKKAVQIIEEIEKSLDTENAE